MSQNTEKQSLINQINEMIIKICQSELNKFFEELKEDIYIKLESDIGLAMKILQEVYKNIYKYI